MLTAFNTFIKNNKLCLPRHKVLVAVSGGLDSVVLLNLFAGAGYHVAIAHCNFKLRGDESDGDEDFVRSLAGQLGVELFVKVCPAGIYAQQHGVTIQEAARSLRYAFFDELMRKHGFDRVAMAHHLDDDLETFFINLIRGSGLQGLKGMPVMRNAIIRPLMFATRNQIENYAGDNGLKWREDSSNASDKYLRNDIRHHLLPELKRAAHGLDPVFRSLSHLKEDASVFEWMLNNMKQTIFRFEKEHILLPFEKLKSDIDGNVWLYYLLKDFGFQRKETDKIFVAIKNKAVGKHFLSEAYELLIDRNYAIVRKIEVKPVEEYFVRKGNAYIEMPFKAVMKVLSGSEADATELTNPEAAFLDYKKLKFPLIIRKWQRGDRFHPFGMKGSKLLSDFFTDLKLSQYDKERVWLLVSGDEIVWVVGYRIAEPYRVSSQTDKLLYIKLNRIR